MVGAERLEYLGNVGAMSTSAWRRSYITSFRARMEKP